MVYPRCGHTSMYEYFGLEPYSLAYRHHNDFKNSTADVKIVVIRNPYDRLVSAVRVTDTVQRSEAARGRKNFDRKDWISKHSRPELSDLIKVQGVNYKIIDFYRLNEYIPVGPTTIPTFAIQPQGWEDWMAEYYTKQQMKAEFAAYEKIMQSRPQMNVREWHRLTADPAPNINTIAVKYKPKDKKGMPPEKAFEMMLDQAFGAINENTKLVNQSYHTIQTLQKRIEVLESELNKIKNH